MPALRPPLSRCGSTPGAPSWQMGPTMDDLPGSGPSNAEFFEFLARRLSFSIFSRSGSVLTSFKTTIEFVFVPEGTADGPAEGLLFEGTAPMSYAAWSDLVAGFAMTSVESRDDGGALTRVFRANEEGEVRPPLPDLKRTPPAGPEPVVGAREEVLSDRAHYAWAGPGRGGGDVGRFSLWVRRIACRGADKGLPAQILFGEKLRQYGRRQKCLAAGEAGRLRSPPPEERNQG